MRARAVPSRNWWVSVSSRIYLDHAATTPLSPTVFEAMKPYLLSHFGNASSIHGEARGPKAAIKRARNMVARHFCVAPGEIYFTSSGTESVNWALKGVAFAHGGKGRHIVTTAVEHHAALHALDFLTRQGFEVTYLPVDEAGVVSLTALEKALRRDTILVSVMAANNEIGTIQPLKAIGDLCRERDILFHTDAVQMAGVMPMDLQALGIDLMSLSAHKFYGPKGVGALYVRGGVPIENLLHGGSQERGRRGGTENTAGIVGLAKALEEIREHAKEWKRVEKLRDYVIEELLSLEDARLNGATGEGRLPGNIHMSFRHVDGEALLMALDLQGIAASSGSACTSGAIEPSHVLQALGLQEQVARGSIRLTLGLENTQEEIEKAVSAMKAIVPQLRRFQETRRPDSDRNE